MESNNEFENKNRPKANHEELKYTIEHLTCQHYTKKDPLLYIINIAKNELIKLDRLDCLRLIFIIKGSISVSTGIYINKSLTQGHMFVLDKGDYIYMRGLENSILMSCRLDSSVSLCNAFTLKQLQETPLDSVKFGQNIFPALPIKERLQAELNITYEVMTDKLLCFHYLKVKRDIFLLLLRGYYLKEELAFLFHFVQNTESEFKDLVIKNYACDINAEQLISLTGLPAATFNRKFKKAFGMTIGRWLISKRKENILRDLIMTDLSEKEIANKYNITPNYLSSFCKKQFESTPSSLRKSCNNNANSSSDLHTAL